MKFERKRDVFIAVTLLAIIVSTSLFFGWYAGYNRIFSLQTQPRQKTFTDVSLTYHKIKDDYLKDVDENTLATSAVVGMLNGLQDEYSYYLSKEEYQEIKKVKAGRSLQFETLQEDVAYLKINHFGQNLDIEFKEVAEELENQNIESLIIDLRDNRGGLSEQIIFLLNKFIEEGIFFEEFDRSLEETVVQQADGTANFSHIDLVILINSETSSAAEQFASAIKENERGTLIGQTTFGKSTVGNYFELGDGSAFHLTTGEWSTKNGDSISGSGINPDIEITEDPNTPENEIIQEAVNILSD